MKQIVAFDGDHIHAGNKGLSIDHAEVSRRVDALMEGMSIEDLLNQMRGLQTHTIDGLYYAGGDEDAGIPPFRMVDGPRGARAGKATAFPVAIARGATFDVDLENRIGKAIGLEVLAKGGNVVLAPTINLLRHPGWGRAQESYSEDPFHMGAMGVSFVSGAQNHVLASPKHFALNNQENTRFTMSANADERVLHEIYLPHFKRCVMEGAAASVMSAYNKVNGTYCGESDLLLNDILRNEWRFSGFVESDWFLGTRSTAPAIKAGMDIEMPAAYRYSDQNIAQALVAGELTEGDLRACARRAIYQKLAWGLDKPAVTSTDVVESKAHVDLAREAAEKSMVLLKNKGGLLPLTDQAGLKIALVGNLASIANLGDRGSSFVESSAVTSPESGLRSYLKAAQISTFADLESLP
ncbi:MAG: glycoside hydrolase family 3 C-terminal domain-containing protein, partial [Proteobacteria bacterium]|nr:glycoside hydrolase family 3 C-terminal domain-containing protein [Pseudomonadota bacterium]